jgi:hypothetical protein
MNMNFVLIIYKSKTHLIDLDPLPGTTVILQTTNRRRSANRRRSHHYH